MKHKILIVEDESIAAESIKLILENKGYNICGIAASADEALKQYKKQEPDLVLLDIKLDNNTTSFEIVNEIKKNGTPFIYLTAYNDSKIRLEAKKTEPYGFFIKPYLSRELISCVEFAIYKSKNEIKQKRTNKMLSTLILLNKTLRNCTDTDNLFQKACDILMKQNIFEKIYIAKYDIQKQLALIASGGFKSNKNILQNMLLKNKLPLCFSKSIKNKKVNILDEENEGCFRCPLINEMNNNNIVLTKKIGYQNINYGIMGAWVSKKYFNLSDNKNNEDEIKFFSEIIETIAYKLHIANNKSK
ncbi:MAG: response regulator [Spirochaetia bacterium]|nr:response regulator [Spirochaetia bacterium]